MTLVFDSLSRSTIPRSLRVAQALACLSVACATLNVARGSTTPAMHLEHMQFPDSSLFESAPVPTT